MSPFLSKFFSKLSGKKSPKSMSPDKKIMMDGQGTMTYPGGMNYVGEWKDGKHLSIQAVLTM